MKLLILGEEKGMFANLVDWINQHTDSEACLWEKLKAVKDKHGSQVSPCPMTDPDLVLCLNNHVLWEELELMGITNKPKRAIYLLAAPQKRGGPYAPDPRHVEFNSFYFSQTELDKHFLKMEYKCPITLEMCEREVFPNLTFLPLPIDINQPEVTPNTDTLTVAQTMSSGVMMGAASKGFYYLEQVHNELDFDIDLIFGVSREEAMQRKAGASLIYDNHMGNIGVSGLESLAQGMPVIGRFNSIVKENWGRLADGEPLPVISFTTKDDLKALLTEYMNDMAQLTAMGVASRAWMQAHATPEKIAHYWITKIEEML